MIKKQKEASAATTIIIVQIVDETKRQAEKTKAKFTVALSSFHIHRHKKKTLLVN